MYTPGLDALTAMAVALLAAEPAAGPPPGPMLPRTTRPIVYTINYSGDTFRKADAVEQFRTAPPDLLHVGKAVPISHHWGPIRLYHGENQYTGGPGHTLSRENIALLSPAALTRRIEVIRRTLTRCHKLGIREIVPYISYHTLAGDHQRRLGFWAFYDRWDTYARWAGPRPDRDPFDWLVVDRRGQFVGGSCGGYSPAYYAPLHRYRACINHPDWARWHGRLIRLVAEVGYDGCFVDNAHPDPCYCPHCRGAFREFLRDSHDVPWVRRLAAGHKLDQLALDSPDVPAELVRRWRVLRTGEHLGELREAGRRVKPGFTIFPNSGRIDECLTVGGRCDRLMFESSFSPGILAAGVPPEEGDVAIEVGAGPATAQRIGHRYSLRDRATWMEMQADLSLPARAQVGRTTRLEARVVSVGASPRDGDFAEAFHLLLRRHGAEPVRLDLSPAGAIGGSGSSRKVTPPPVTLRGDWTPAHAGRYAVHFAFRYTDESHRPDTDRRLHVAKLSRSGICRTHLAELLFTQHMPARAIYLGYEARRAGRENVQELALAEMAAFSGGGGFSGRGKPQAKYRAFFREHPELFAGWQPFAPAAVLFAYWGPNHLSHAGPIERPTIHEDLAATHRPFAALVDASLPEQAEALSPLRAICLESPRYEMSPAQLRALGEYVRRGGWLVLGHEKVTINGRPASGLVGKPARGRISVWNQEDPPAPVDPIAPTDGLRRNLRFALYRKADRLAVHAVNYNVCLLDKARRILAVAPTPLSVPLPGGWTSVRATCFAPGAEPQPLPCTVAAGKARLQLPRTRIYRIVLLEAGRVEPRPRGKSTLDASASSRRGS